MPLAYRRLPSTALAAGAALAALLLAGCGSDDGEAGGAAGASSADVGASTGEDAGGAEDVPGVSGAFAVSASDDRSGLPEGFPTDIPIPIGTLRVADATGGSAYLLEILVEVPPANAATSYRDLLIAANWTLDPTSTDDNIVLTRGEGRTVTVGSSPESDTSTVLSIAVEGAV
ncbi:hypothetical protein [Aeromicrobium sp.]|uniref:hypothetical protein n=1 Tax=Aeromicrobium sp. TaxID=1871063 RepID=UPI003513A76C